ncbi:MAG: leucine-rich repeat domain-containing protein [Clostridia bacterium]|jgi:Leucine-rich repeat (LRR) protein|nr:leucine-rich repeat domain-containing protein [Clostridia bacterium]MBR2643830.1 leucine-rich repeat domain-containing protein [Clostridia bacterium]
MDKSKKSGIAGVPLWLILVLCCTIILMTLVISFLVLLHLDIVRCVPAEAPAAEATPSPVVTEPPTEAPTEEPTPLIITPNPELPEPTATPEPTEEPTPKPTEAPKATKKPDSFTFGGKKIKTGTTKINGKSLGINGKKNKLKHIKKDEVKDLVELCPDLEELILDYCYMDDYTPLGDLTKLRKLQLSSCGAGGGNAIKNIDWLEDLTELRSLNLVHNNISDTTALAALKKLTYLNLGDNPLEDEDLEPIGYLTNLETLYLYDLKKITDVQPLTSLTKLTFLHIGRNSKLKNVKPLTALKKLTQLRVNRTNISDISYFDQFPALKKLDIGKCPILFHDYYNLQTCSHLRKIVLEQGDNDASLAIDDMINNGYPFEISYNWSDA